MSIDRRTFLQLLSASAASATFPASISRALEIPAHHRTGTIEDVEHIVFMMQENRSFDHYLGSLRGVRGFGDPRTIKLPSGKSVWYQPDSTNPDGYVLPFHPGAPNLGLQFLEDLAHDWTTTHGAWNEGKYDQWVPQKGTTTMAHLTRSDIPFHYALADAFTVCDAYHCSLLSSTDPNRYHMWTGWVGNDGSGGGPVIDNAEAGYGWSTYPERLQSAGISWKIYQDIGTGLDAAGSWGWTSATPTSAITATTRCSTSTSTRTRQPAARLPWERRPGPIFPQAARSSTSSGRMFSPANCRRFHGSRLRKPTPSTRTGRQITERGMSRRFSTR